MSDLWHFYPEVEFPVPLGTRALCGHVADERTFRPIVAADARCADCVGLLACPACNGEGGRVSYTSGSRMPDPQTEVVCSRCEGEGVVPR